MTDIPFPSCKFTKNIIYKLDLNELVDYKRRMIYVTIENDERELKIYLNISVVQINYVKNNYYIEEQLFAGFEKYEYGEFSAEKIMILKEIENGNFVGPMVLNILKAYILESETFKQIIDYFPNYNKRMMEIEKEYFKFV